MTKIELQSSPPSSKTLAAMARLLLRGGSLVRSALTSSSVTLTHTRCVSSFSGMSEDGLSESQIMVRHSIQDLCKPFDDDYWLQKDRKQEYPHELYDSLAAQGWIGICMPSSFGGAGLGISEATIMLQTIAESGASVAGAQSIHANIYPLMPIIEFASQIQKDEWLPKMINGEIRSCFAVTEPNTGLETLKTKTKATREGDEYIISGQKIWTSSAQVASHAVLLARTSEPQEGKSRSHGLSLFLIPLRKKPCTPHNSKQDSALLPGIEMRKIEKMGGNMTDANEVWFDDYRVPASCLIGEEGRGFKQILHGMNAERCLLAGEAIGTGYAALVKAVQYASSRVVFDRPIGMNQAIQHPLAKAWTELEAARHLTYTAARMYDEKAPTAGAQANAAKYFAAEAGYRACETAVMTHGGMGYAKEYHVERYLREIFVPRLAPVSREMILNYIGTSVLGLPKSY